MNSFEEYPPVDPADFPPKVMTEKDWAELEAFTAELRRRNEEFKKMKPILMSCARKSGEHLFNAIILPSLKGETSAP